MKVRNLKYRLAKTIATLVIAAGTFLGGSLAEAQQVDHAVGDASFDDNPVDAGLGYSYWNGPPDTAWFSSGSWWYNSGYDSSRRPTPRTGDQAIHGIGTYAWQALADPFVAGREYTLSVYIAGDSDAVDDTDRSWLYIYDGSSTPAVFDNDSLVGYRYNQDGTTEFTVGDGTPTNTGWPRDGGQDWGLATLSYTATAAVDGNPIGIAFYGAGDVAFDDVSVMSTPEPSTIVLCGLGILGVVSVLRRRDE